MGNIVNYWDHESKRPMSGLTRLGIVKSIKVKPDKYCLRCTKEKVIRNAKYCVMCKVDRMVELNREQKIKKHML